MLVKIAAVRSENEFLEIPLSAYMRLGCAPWRFVFQQPFFQPDPSLGRKTAQSSIGSDNPVAGDYQWHTVGGHYVTDGPCSVYVAYAPGEPAVRKGLARFDSTATSQNSLPKLAGP